MFTEHNYKRQWDLHHLIPVNILLNKDIYMITTVAGFARWRVLLAGVILLTGFAGSLQALPENSQYGYVNSSLGLNFSNAKPITLSMMTGDRTGTSNARNEELEYASVSEEVSAVNIGPRNTFSTNITLAWDSSRPLSQESGSVAIEPSKIMLASVTQPGVDRLARNIDAAHTESGDNLLRGEMPLVKEVVRSPFATIALAVFALLGLVSVARRNDI